MGNDNSKALCGNRREKRALISGPASIVCRGHSTLKVRERVLSALLKA